MIVLKWHSTTDLTDWIDPLTEKSIVCNRGVQWQRCPFDGVDRLIEESGIDQPIDTEQRCTIAQTHRVKSHLSSRIDELIFRIGRTHRRNDTTTIETHHQMWEMKQYKSLPDGDQLRFRIFDFDQEIACGLTRSVATVDHGDEKLIRLIDL